MPICKKCGVDHNWTKEDFNKFSDYSVKILEGFNKENISPDAALFVLAMASGTLSASISVVEGTHLIVKMSQFVGLYVKTIKVMMGEDKTIN